MVQALSCRIELFSGSFTSHYTLRQGTYVPISRETEVSIRLLEESQRRKPVCYLSSPKTSKPQSSFSPSKEVDPRLPDRGLSLTESSDVPFYSEDEVTSDSELSSSETSVLSTNRRETKKNTSLKKQGYVRIPRYLKNPQDGFDSSQTANVFDESPSKPDSEPSIPLPTSRRAERDDYAQNSIARHRTHSLTKTIKQKSPWIRYAVDRIRRSRNSKHRVKDIMDDVVDKMDPGAVYVVLNELQRLHDWRATVELAKWIKGQPWHQPTERFYNMLIGFLGREGQPDMATLLFEEMLLEQVSPNNYTFTALINAYGRARMFSEAMEVFEHMKSCEAESRPNAVTCNTLIGVLCRGKKYVQAVEIFRQMKDGSHGLQKEKCKPSTVTYNTLIDAMCREGRIEEAVDVLADLASGQLDSAVVPDTVTYNIIIDACGKAGNARKAEQLVRGMEERALRPDNATYTALIDAYGKTGEIEKAEFTFRRMQKLGVRPDVLSYTALIASFGRNALLEKAEELFGEMQKQRVQPNEVTYLALIDAHGKAGQPRQAEKLFKAMASSGYKQNVYTYGAMMDAYGKCGEYQLVVNTFQEMRREGCRPNLITYAALLTACGRSENWEDALLMLYCLQQSGSEWELCMCRLVLGGPEEEEEIWVNAAKMFEGMQRFSASMRRSFYNALIDVLWSYGLRERAAKVAAVGRILEVYGDDMFLYSSRENCSEWIVDLHDNSVGSAVTHLYAWLKELRLAWEWQPEAPGRISIVTGWGKHTSRGESPLKLRILAELQGLKGPFEECVDNAGRIVGSGDEVKTWLLKPGMEEFLVLKDTVNPRPIGEMPYEHL